MVSANEESKPVEELMQVELFEGKSAFTTRIGTQMSHAETESIIACLRRNVDIFAFSSKDLLGIDPDVALHSLNVNPTVKSVKRKLRQFGAEKEVIIKEEVKKLLEARHIVKLGILSKYNSQNGCPMRSWFPREALGSGGCALILEI